jgi:phage gpG-like protein
MQSEAVAWEDLPRHLGAVATALETASMADALAEAKTEIQRGIRAGFNSGIDVQTGTGWAPRKRRYPHPTLMKSGALMQAATGGGAGSIARVSARQVDVGVSSTVIGYAGFHQSGTSNMAARPFVGAAAETLDLIAEKIADAGLQVFR